MMTTTTMMINNTRITGRKEKSHQQTCRCQLWSKVGIVASSFFFFFFFFSSIAQRSRRVNVYRRLFEYGHYYENRKHDNHESLPELRTMSSSERDPRLWTGANGNKTVPERQYRPRGTVSPSVIVLR